MLHSPPGAGLHPSGGSPLHTLAAVRGAGLFALALLAACAPLRAPDPGAEGMSRGDGLILQATEGERRVRRPRPGSPTAQTSPFILKVDGRNGASPDLVMGYEEIAPGESVQPHRHLIADEIVFIHQGTGNARLGMRESTVSAGATLYVPRNTVISLRNTGAEPLGIAFIFSKPGFEQLMRENSAPEGEPAAPLSAEEQARIRDRHRWHTLAGIPDADSAAVGNGGLILDASQGERRVPRRPPGSTTSHPSSPFLLKVDRRNGASADLVMGYEDVAPGDSVPPHRHLQADEIIFVHRGSGTVRLGSREASLGAGATVYVPRDSWIALRNTGSEPLGIVFVLSKPGFEDLLRETSVPEGRPPLPLSAEDLARIRARHRRHTVFRRP